MLEDKILRDINESEIRDAVDSLPDDSVSYKLEFFINERCREMFKDWSSAFNELKKTAVSIRRSYGLMNITEDDVDSVYGNLCDTAPYNQATWNASVGIEHRKGTLWFRQSYRIRKSEDGPRWSPIEFNHKSVARLVRACVFNSLLAENLSFSRGRDDRIKRNAISNEVSYVIRKSSELRGAADIGDISKDLLNDIAERFGAVAEHMYVTYRLKYDVRLEAHMGIVSELFHAESGNGSVNKALRSSMVLGLLNMGFADCKSRTEQESLIAYVCKNSLFRDDIARSLRRRLSRSVIDGVVALIPYTTEEISEMHRESVNEKRDSRNEEQRSAAIERLEEYERRVSRGEKLNASERSWLSKARKKYR